MAAGITVAQEVFDNDEPGIRLLTVCKGEVDTTAIQFPATSQRIRGFIMYPVTSNSGLLFIGTSTVDSNSGQGIEANDAYRFMRRRHFNPQSFYVIGSASTQKFTLEYIYD